MKIIFELDKKQSNELEEWINKLPKGPEGAIGGRLEYILAPTNLGTVLKVKDTITGLVIDLTDYDSW